MLRACARGIVLANGRISARRSIEGALLAVLVLAVTWAPYGAGQGTGVGDLDLLDDMSVDHLVGTIEALQAHGSRAFMLPSADQVAAYLASEFASMGLEVREQEFAVGDVTSRNVIAWKNGTDPEEAHVLLGAHYDSENRLATNLSLAESLPAPGADDDASGIAVVMEAARLISTTTTAATVTFVAFGAEERGYDGSGGLAGSAFFAETESLAGVNYRATIVLDMVGYRDDEANIATIITNERDDDAAASIAYAADTRGLDLEIRTLLNEDIDYSDHASFWAQGYPSLLITEELDSARETPVNPYYHTESDILASLSLDQLTAVAEAVIGGALSLACETPEPSQDSSDSLLIGVAVVGIVSSALIFMVVSRRRNSEYGKI
jgi:hypothetical protein